MTWWLVVRTLLRAPRRLLLEALGVAFPVAMLGATLLFIDASLPTMTRVALDPVRIEMRALAAGIGTDMGVVDRQLANVPGVTRVDRFATAQVSLVAPGQTPITARLFAVDPSYFAHHPWVRVVDGSVKHGLLLAQTLRTVPGFEAPATLAIKLPGDVAPDLPFPVAGTVDLREATPWFEIPTGEVQGDIALVPRSLVVDYSTFESAILPSIRAASAQTGIGVTNEGGTDLPPVSIEAHIAVDHASYPHDPGQAAVWSDVLHRTLEREAAGSVVVADNAFEALDTARTDAANAKIIFLLLGLPGAIAAGALGIAATSALTEAQRREYALLELRGATPRQLARLSATGGLVGATLGLVAGVIAALAAVGAVLGRAPWSAIAPQRFVFSLVSAAVIGIGIVAIKVMPRLRAAKRPELLEERRQIARTRRPLWLRARLDLVAFLVGAVILAVNVAGGGLKITPVEGQIVTQAFFVLLGPLALWLGATLLGARILLAILAARSRPDRARPLSTWPAAAVRWLGRRPGRATAALLLGTLAIAFGTEVVTFVATYASDVRDEDQAALGADLRVIPPPTSLVETLPPTRELSATSPVWIVPARIGSDRKNLATIDVRTYGSAVRPEPTFLTGGLAQLRRDPHGIIVSKELSLDQDLHLGDALKVTVYPDAEGKSRLMVFNVDGIYRTFPPTNPFAEVATTTTALADADLHPPDFFLARTAGRANDKTVAARVAHSLGKGTIVKRIGEIPQKDRRSLTTINIGGLGRIAATGAALVAALGVAVLGAFVILERRREAAVLQAVGADSRQIAQHIVVEAGLVVLGSIGLGLVIGLGLGMLTVRVLGLFFALPTPLLVVPAIPLTALTLGTIVGSAAALALAMRGLFRIDPAETLRAI